MTLTTLAFFSVLVCFTQRSCVRGRTVEMALESDNLLLLQVAPWSFRPVDVETGLNPYRATQLSFQDTHRLSRVALPRHLGYISETGFTERPG